MSNCTPIKTGKTENKSEADLIYVYVSVHTHICKEHQNTFSVKKTWSNVCGTPSLVVRE